MLALAGLALWLGAAQATPQTGSLGTQSGRAAEPQPPPAPPPTEPPPPPPLQEVGTDEAFGILGKQVRGAAGENMGLVVDILVDSDGQPRAAVIDFGGFLGVGNRKVAIDWKLLQFQPSNKDAPILLNLVRAQVQAAPEYKSNADKAKVIETPPVPDTLAAPEPSPALKK